MYMNEFYFFNINFFLRIRVCKNIVMIHLKVKLLCLTCILYGK